MEMRKNNSITEGQIESNRENILQKLANFDFSAPVTVDVIFEDSDNDDKSSPDVIVEKKCEADEFPVPSCSKTETENRKYINNDLSITDNQNNKSAICNDNYKNATETGTYDVDCQKNLKRKLGDELQAESFEELKARCKSIIIVNKMKNSEQNVQTPLETSSIVETNKTNTIKPDDKGNQYWATYVGNLLKTIAEHLVVIMQAYVRYKEISRLSSDVAKVNYEWNYFTRLKYHLFNLSYSTVVNIILPEMENSDSIKQFLNEALKIGSDRKFTLDLKTQIEPLFHELVEWTKQKSKTLNKLKSNTEVYQQQNISVLMQHLTGPQKSVNTPNALNNHNENANCPVIPSLEMFCSSAQLPFLPQSQKCASKNNGAFVERSNNDVFAKHANTVSNYGNNRAPNRNLYYQTAAANTFANYMKENVKSAKSVLFSSGPPERQMSIAVEPSLLQSLSGCNTLNSTSPSQPIRNMTQPFQVQMVQNSTAYKQNCSKKLGSEKETGNMTSLQNMPAMSNMLNENYLPKAPLPWQNIQRQNIEFLRPATDTSQMNAQAQLLQPLQGEVSKGERTRSASTDSGFMSPVHCSSPLETNQDVYDASLNGTPIITHVTSLNPGASYIAEGCCYVCGKATRKMCIGCYTKYYCSTVCQRADWNYHIAHCKKHK